MVFASFFFFFFPEKAEAVASLSANPPSSDLVALAPPPSAPPPTLALVSRQMGDSKPPQAIVKPQILTHIIEGFVIQEGAEPFPVRAGPERRTGRGEITLFINLHSDSSKAASAELFSH